MPLTASEIIQTQTSNTLRKATKSSALTVCKSKHRMLLPVLQKNLGLCLLWAALSCSLGMLWGRGSALSQAQRQPGPGKMIRGDKALSTHSLFGIQADPRVSSWAAFTGAEPELMDLGWIPQPSVSEPWSCCHVPSPEEGPWNYTWATNQLYPVPNRVLQLFCPGHPAVNN